MSAYEVLIVIVHDIAGTYGLDFDEETAAAYSEVIANTQKRLRVLQTSTPGNTATRNFRDGNG